MGAVGVATSECVKGVDVVVVDDLVVLAKGAVVGNLIGLEDEDVVGETGLDNAGAAVVDPTGLVFPMFEDEAEEDVADEAGASFTLLAVQTFFVREATPVECLR